MVRFARVRDSERAAAAATTKVQGTHVTVQLLHSLRLSSRRRLLNLAPISRKRCCACRCRRATPSRRSSVSMSSLGGGRQRRVSAARVSYVVRVPFIKPFFEFGAAWIESGVPFPFPFSSPLPSPMSRRSPAHCGFCDRLLNEPPFRRCGRCRSTLYCDRCTYMPSEHKLSLGSNYPHALTHAPVLSPPPPPLCLPTACQRHAWKLHKASCQQADPLLTAGGPDSYTSERAFEQFIRKSQVNLRRLGASVFCAGQASLKNFFDEVSSRCGCALQQYASTVAMVTS